MKYKLQNSHEIIKHIIFLELGPLYQENDDFQQKLNALAYIRNMENGTAFLSETKPRLLKFSLNLQTLT